MTQAKGEGRVQTRKLVDLVQEEIDGGATSLEESTAVGRRLCSDAKLRRVGGESEGRVSEMAGGPLRGRAARHLSYQPAGRTAMRRSSPLTTDLEANHASLVVNRRRSPSVCHPDLRFRATRGDVRAAARKRRSTRPDRRPERSRNSPNVCSSVCFKGSDTRLAGTSFRGPSLRKHLQAGGKTVDAGLRASGRLTPVWRNAASTCLIDGDARHTRGLCAA